MKRERERGEEKCDYIVSARKWPLLIPIHTIKWRENCPIDRFETINFQLCTLFFCSCHLAHAQPFLLSIVIRIWMIVSICVTFFNRLFFGSIGTKKSVTFLTACAYWINSKTWKCPTPTRKHMIKWPVPEWYFCAFATGWFESRDIPKDLQNGQIFHKKV